MQEALLARGFDAVGQPDGVFGANAEAAVRAFQQSAGLDVDGKVGPATWAALFTDAEAEDGASSPAADWLAPLLVNHSFNGGVRWRLAEDGVRVEDSEPEHTGGQPQTVARVWNDFGESIVKWSVRFETPVELVVATICTESGGNPSVVREEPGFTADEETPHRVSPGLMQTLISTARETLGDDAIDRAWLLQPDHAVQAGASYIRRQRSKTGMDPPKVACAYNAGGVYANDGADNRWKMRQFPIGSGHHADRFVKWFNDCFRLFDRDGSAPEMSFYHALRR